VQEKPRIFVERKCNARSHARLFLQLLRTTISTILQRSKGLQTASSSKCELGAAGLAGRDKASCLPFAEERGPADASERLRLEFTVHAECARGFLLVFFLAFYFTLFPSFFAVKSTS